MYELQYAIAVLSKQGLNTKAFELMDFFSFHLINRLYSIYYLSGKSSKNTVGYDNFSIKTDNDKLSLLKSTKYTNHLDPKPIIVRRVKIPKIKNNPKEVRYLGIGNLKDKVMQKMLLNLIDPFYETVLDKDVYGWRKGRSQVHAAAQAYKYLYQGQSRKTLILLDIKNFFDNINHNYLLSIKVPSKFRVITNK